MKKQLALVAVTVSLALTGVQAAVAQSMELSSPQSILTKQSNNLFSANTKSQSLSSDPLFNTLLQDETILTAQPVGINPQMISGEQSSMTINLGPGLVFNATNNNSYWLNGDYQVWTGDINTGSILSSLTADGKKKNANTAVFVRNGDRVFGEMRIDGRIFGIQTTDLGKHILTEIKTSDLDIPLGDDTPKKIGSRVLSGQGFASDVSDQGAFANAVGPNGSTIRVLQTATNEAINALGGTGPTVDRMNFFLAQSNDVYARNGLDLELQDAGRFRSGFAELAFMDQNLDAIANPNDGRGDAFAGSTRNSRGADIVTIMTSTSASTFGVSLCGIADAIAADPNQGFFAISTSSGCATGFTFVHELAHLFGARHDNDSNTFPFSFGHGFVNAGANIRTIMAVNSNPQQRVGVFSTDDQNFQGNTIGNSSFADNERVHETRRQIMASFR
jgi:hypothetical protein